MAEDFDVIIVWINVHGGSYHKLIHLHELLKAQGVKSLLLLNCDAPLGLQKGLDFEDHHIKNLWEAGIRITSIDDIRSTLTQHPSKLVLFDGNKTPYTDTLISLVQKKHGSKTGEVSSLLGDFIYHSTDFIFIQSLTALWFLMDYSKNRRKRRNALANIKKVYISGNIFFEPIANSWTSDINSKEDFFAKYELDRSRPLCLWLPDREDSIHPSFRKIVDIIESQGMNVVTKLHPWEYKQYIHGYDTFGTGTTVDERWALKPLQEQDSSWAFKYCDIAIYRGSAVGLELPFWEKPGIGIWPKDDYRTLLCKECSVRISSIDELPKALASDKLQSLTEADYKKSRGNVSTLWQNNSFTQLVECIMDALETPTEYPVVGSHKKLRRLYLGRIPWAILKGEHYIEHCAARLGLSIFQNENVPEFLYTNSYLDFPKG